MDNPADSYGSIVVEPHGTDLFKVYATWADGSDAPPAIIMYLDELDEARTTAAIVSGTMGIPIDDRVDGEA